MTGKFNAGPFDGAWVERPMPWLDCFEIGDRRIDDEHRGLLAACNDLCALAANGTAWPVARTAAVTLIATVETHFASEETLFPAIRFPRTREHLREHDVIRKALVNLLAGDPAIELRVAAATARMILVEHIIRHDLGFKTFVQERGAL